MINVSDLATINIFSDFPPEFLSRLLPDLGEREFSPGEMIIYRGDPGNSMFMVLEGSVEITMRNEEGQEYRLAVLGQGEVFGEMALITGEPRSADVRAISRVRVAELSQGVFFKLIYEYPELNDKFIMLVVQRRARTMVRSHFLSLEREEIIANLFAQEPPKVDYIQGKSKWSAAINKEINALAQSAENVLISGERGTGKMITARLIHFKGAEGARPLLHVDCADPPAIQREKTKRRYKDPLLLEIAQEAALFGHGANAGSYARGIRRGNVELAHGGTIILENVESLTPYVQKRLADFIGEGTFVRKGETQRISSIVRFIATTSLPFEKLREMKDMDPMLTEALGQRMLKMTPLRERKKDIPILAMHILAENNERFGKSITGFSAEALNDLIDHDWPLNIHEMKQVIERAAAIAEGDTVTAANVFFSPLHYSSLNRINLLRIEPIRRIAAHPLVPDGLKYLTVPFMLGLIILTLLGPATKNPANLLVWAFWWPILIITVFLGARSWCGFCPLPTISNGINFWRRRFLKTGAFIEKYGIWIAITGFIIIFTTEHAFGMFKYSRATGLLLLSILAGTVIVNFIFGKRAWCKHICPLGKMVAHFSALSMVELTSNSNVCSGQCEGHECVTAGNCPMGLHPAIAAGSKDCILCLSCLKKCTHRAVRLDFRLPWIGAILPRKWDFAAACFSMLLLALTVGSFLMGGPLHDLPARIWPGGAGSYYIVMAEVTMVASVFFIVAAGFPYLSNWKQNFCVIGYCCLYLGFAGFFSIYFDELAGAGGNVLAWSLDLAGFPALAADSAFHIDLTILKGVILFALISGFCTSIYLLMRLGRSYSIPKSVHRLSSVLISAAFIMMVLLI